MFRNYGKMMRKHIRTLLNLLRKVRNSIKIYELRLRGVKVDPSVWVHPTVEAIRSRGEISIGENSSLDRGVLLRTYGGSIKIGSNCSVNPYSILYGGGGLVIGNGVRIAAHTVIIPSNHIFSDPDKCIHEQGLSQQGIVIEDDVWIGAGVRVLDGVVIREGTVVGAGAVVAKSTEPYTVVAGVPAKQVSTRT